MKEYLHKYQHLSALICSLPENVSVAQYVLAYRAAIVSGEVVAIPLGETFQVLSLSYKEDLVRLTPEFTTWHERVVRSLGLRRVRKGVVVHAEDVNSGVLNLDDLAEQYRRQMAARSSVKRPKKSSKKGRPKLLFGSGELIASHPALLGKPESGAASEG